MYHNVAPEGETYPHLSPSATSYFVSRSAFDAQLSAIADCGGRCMAWEELAAFYRTGTPSLKQASDIRYPVLFTFDDGWKDCVEVGGPLLAARDWQAVMFVTTDFIGRPHSISREGLSKLDPRVFRVGSHARSHRMLSLLDETEIRAELSDSRNLLEDILGYEVDSISIPSGAVDVRVRRIAADCGYKFVFDSEVRVNRRGDSPLSIGRVAMMHDTPVHDLQRYVRQNIMRERVRRAILQGPKRLLGLRRYEKLRRRLLGEKPGQQVTHQS
jgi:peptidoglycan/xylan/chitin deacetylase (PgdA/CDA1 family)